MDRVIKVHKDFFLQLLVFIAIYCSHDTILFGTNRNEIFITIRKAVPFLLMACLLIKQRVIYLTKTNLFILFVTIIIPFVSCVMNRENMNNYIYRAAIMVCAILFVINGLDIKFFQIYNRIIYFLSIWSVATYLLMVLFPGIVSKFPVVYNIGDAPYYFMGFSTINSELHYGIIRNSSIFREPGVFCVMLSLALLIEIIILRQKNAKMIWTIIIAMITTYSTAGYIVLAFLAVYGILFEREIKNKGLLTAAIVIASVILAIGTGFFDAEGPIFGKFIEGSNSYGSWLARWSSITKSLSISLQNPLFGIGRYALYDVVLNVSGVYRAVDNTNTLLIGFAAYGLLFGGLITYGCWRFIWTKQRKMLATLFLFGVLLMVLSNEDMGQNIVFYALVFSGLSYSGRSETECV